MPVPSTSTAWLFTSQTSHAAITADASRMARGCRQLSHDSHTPPLHQPVARPLLAACLCSAGARFGECRQRAAEDALAIAARTAPTKSGEERRGEVFVVLVACLANLA